MVRAPHPSAVPDWMVEGATARRLAGDWRGACAVAGVDLDVDLGAIRRVHGTEVLRRVEDDLTHLAPDLLRWHLPRRPDGLLRSGFWYPLALFPDGHALVAYPPAWFDRPQRIAVRFVRLGVPGRAGTPDDSLLLLRELWDSRCTAQLRARCGGVTRLPFFTTGGARLDDDAVAGDGPEGRVEFIAQIDDEGRPADAWGAAGFDLDVLLFDPRWGRDRTDPAAFEPAAAVLAGPPAGAGTAERADRSDRRAAVVGRALGWLRPAHWWLAEAAGRVRRHLLDVRANAPWDNDPARVLPWRTDLAEDAGLFRVDLRGRCLVLDRLGTPRPRARLVATARYRHADAEREAAEAAEFGVVLDRIPRIPHGLARRPAELDALRSGELTPDDLHPLVHAALFPDRPPPRPRPAPPLPAAVRVHCDEATHEVVLRGGTVAVPHRPAEVERERVLEALGGHVAGCVAARDGWRDPAVRMPRRMRALRAELLARVWHGDGPAVLAAVVQGVDPHVRDERGRTLLHLLPWLSDEEGRRSSPALVRRLLDAGLDIDVRDLTGETPLHSAVALGAPGLVRGLLGAGADPFAMSGGPNPRAAAWTLRPELQFLRAIRR
ncbi:ankyrin repeat domain-containing protein [Dactylosporangium sp. NPDC005572]|uniref:ankyrin repeat domain-containing protein n=1 Tax=Dactylosporangium sp. NPDC005572 TaxID=3156889 RepID=UPI0033A5A5A0